MDAKTYSFLDIEVQGGIAVITLNGPDPENRWDLKGRAELDRLPREAADDDDIRVLVFTGAGDHFSGGQYGPIDGAGQLKRHDRSTLFMRSWLELDKPMIVAMNGRAVDLSLTLALLSDILIAERHVTFVDWHVLNGMASSTGPWLWPLSTGLRHAKRYLLTGDEFSAEEAERIGLVTEVVDTGQSLARALEYATKLAALRPEGVRCTKRALNAWLDMAFTPVLSHALALQRLTRPPE